MDNGSIPLRCSKVSTNLPTIFGGFVFTFYYQNIAIFVKKKRSPGHFSIKIKRLTESSPLLAFDAKAEKSRSLVTAYATLQRRFGYQVWLLPFDQYQCTSRILCREQPLQFFCNSKTANFFK